MSTMVGGLRILASEQARDFSFGKFGSGLTSVPKEIILIIMPRYTPIWIGGVAAVVATEKYKVINRYFLTVRNN